MTFGKIPNQPTGGEQFKPDAGRIEAAAVVLGVHKKKLKVKRGNVKHVARGLAEIAFSMGETNDPEEFAEEMTEEILESLKLVQDRMKNNKKKN